MSKKKNFIEDESLNELADKIIEEKKMYWLNNVNVKYVFVDPYISKTVAGKCIRANKELQHFGKVDYVIEISKKVWDAIDDKTREILLLHEIMHMLVINDEESGELIMKIAPHDLQDFYSIVKEHGVNWLGELKTVIASVMELDPNGKDNIKL